MEKQKPAIKSFLWWAFGWLGFAFLASRSITSQPLPLILFTVIALAIPVALAGSYGAAISQIRRLSYYKQGGWGYAIFSRRLLASVLWLVWAVPTSFILLLQLSLLSAHQWVLMFVSPLVYFAFFTFFSHVNSRELKKKYMALSLSIKLSAFITSIAMTITLAVVYKMFGIGGGFQSLGDAVDAQRINMQGSSQTVIVDISLRLMTLADGAKQYLAGRLNTSMDYLPIIVASIGSFLVFFNASLTYSSLIIPKTEYRRVFGEPSEDEIPPPLKQARVAFIAAASALIVFFVCVPFIGQVETTAKNNQPLLQEIKVVEKRLVEKIDSAFYQRGTIEKLRALNAELLNRIEKDKSIIHINIDKAFSQMEGNVVGYLDWYYSLEAEYMRLGKMLTGQIEVYMQNKLEEYLNLNNPTAELKKTIDSVLANQQTLRNEYQQLRQKILDENRLHDIEDQVSIVSSASLDSLITIPTHIEFVSLDQRVAGGTVAAGVGGLIAGKIASKAIFKGAAKAVFKAAAAKAGGATVGGGVGAVMGSVVPGVGTAVGGFIGGLLGGVLVDAVLLRLEEAVSREEFHREIVSAIIQTRDDFKKRIMVSP